MKQSLQALEHFFPPDFVASLPKEERLHKLLCGRHSRAKIWRQHISDCLELACRYKLVDADFKARLNKGDWESFSATVNELKCAKFLEGIFGINCLHWHPPGQERRVGEFELVPGGLNKPIFVEVKTIVPRKLERMEDHIKDKLRQYAEQVRIPCVLDVTIKEAGNSGCFRGRGFKKFLREELSKVNIANMENPHELPDYRDVRTGMRLKIRILPNSPKLRLRSCHIGIVGGEARWSKDDDYIRHSLKKAEGQLPREKQPCLVLLCSSPEFPIDEDSVTDALFGALVVRYQLINDELASDTEPEVSRKLDGFYRCRRNRKLSATGLYQENLANGGIAGKLEIYHNPWATNPLDYSVFEGKGARQLVKVEEGCMKWRD